MKITRRQFGVQSAGCFAFAISAVRNLFKIPQSKIVYAKKPNLNFSSHPADILLDLGMPDGSAVKAVRELCDEPVYTSNTFGDVENIIIDNMDKQPTMPIELKQQISY